MNRIVLRSLLGVIGLTLLSACGDDENGSSSQNNGGSAAGGSASGGGGTTSTGGAGGGTTTSTGGAGGAGGGGGGPTATCVISSPTKDLLNGIPVADGGDRVSSIGAPYQAAVQVTTDLEDGSDILLNVGLSSGLVATSTAGLATFAGVPLTENGDTTITATCVAADGTRVTSAPITVTVDTATPPMTPQAGLQAGVVTLQNGAHFGPADLSGGNMQICGATTASDALSVTGALAENFCARVNGQGAVCASASAGGAGTGDGACVMIACPGSGTFPLTLTLADQAGNVTEKTLSDITCASSAPQVSFFNPTADVGTCATPGLTQTPEQIELCKPSRILAAGTPGATQVDLAPNTLGAQYNVVGCVNRTTGTATLYGRVASTAGKGSVLGTANVEAVTTTNGSPCEAQGGRVTFSNVTIPNSGMAGDLTRALVDPTVLRMEATDINTETGVGEMTLWVDAFNRSLNVYRPSNLCGSSHSEVDYTPSPSLQLYTEVLPLNVSIGGHPLPTIESAPLGYATIANATFSSADADSNGAVSLVATALAPSGNLLQLGTCDVTVGRIPPTLQWQAYNTSNSTWTPLSTATGLGASTSGTSAVIPDADGGVAGWQGSLRVCATPGTGSLAGVQIVGTAGGVGIGSVPLSTQSDTSNCAVFSDATVADGTSVAFVAQTIGVPDGNATSTVNLPVDVIVPSAAADFAATARAQDRRPTGFYLTWTAPADGTGNVAGYDLRISHSPITAGNFDAAQAVTYTGALPAGGAESLLTSGWVIEKDYYFAIRAYDATGNRSEVVGTSTPVKHQFIKEYFTYVNPADTNLLRWGGTMATGGDLDGDKRDDIVVGTSAKQVASIIFGRADASTPTRVELTGGVTGFGTSMAIISDMNGDGRDELLVSSYTNASSSVYLYYGRTKANWAAVVSEAQADAQFIAGSAFAVQYFGYSMSSVGDFNGDGIPDFAISAPLSSTGSLSGTVTVVFGRGGFSGTVDTSALVSAATPGAYRMNLAGGNSLGFGARVGAVSGFYDGTPALLASVSAATDTSVNNAYAQAGYPASTPPALFDVSASAATHRARRNVYVGWAGLQPGWGYADRPWVFSGEAPANRVTITTGTSATGPFASQVAELVDGVGTYQFGSMVAVSRVGSTTPSRFIGSDDPTRQSEPSFAVGTSAGFSTTNLTPHSILFIERNKITSGTLTPSTIATVTVKLDDAPWLGFAPTNQAADFDGDGYPDVVAASSCLLGYTGNLPSSPCALVAEAYQAGANYRNMGRIVILH